MSRIRVGDPASVTFDAISGRKQAGKADRIDSFGRNRQGDIIYTVYIVLDNQDTRLRWTMTAVVTISPLVAD